MIYYSYKIDVFLKNHGNDANAVMHWFDDNEEWPYDKWGEEVIVHDIKMMSKKDIEEAIKEKLQETVDRELNTDKLYFKWRT